MKESEIAKRCEQKLDSRMCIATVCTVTIAEITHFVISSKATVLDNSFEESQGDPSLDP